MAASGRNWPERWQLDRLFPQTAFIPLPTLPAPPAMHSSATGPAAGSILSKTASPLSASGQCQVPGLALLSLHVVEMAETSLAGQRDRAGKGQVSGCSPEGEDHQSSTLTLCQAGQRRTINSTFTRGRCGTEAQGSHFREGMGDAVMANSKWAPLMGQL